jgi:hypothetical protein
MRCRGVKSVSFTSMRKILLGTVFPVLLTVMGESSAEGFEHDYAVTAYYGKMTDVHSWHDIILHPDDVDFEDARLLTGAMSWTFARYLDNALNLELEGQVVRYFGDQDNWEFNLPVAVRWNRFPWNNTIATTTAFGLGPSYANQVPPVEVELEGDSQRFMAYWFVEVTLGPPQADWSTVLRLHHRSGGLGAITEDGGSNSLGVGVKFSF